MDEAANIRAPYGVPFGTYFDLVDETGTPVDLSTRHAAADVRAGSPEAPGAVVLEVSDTNGRLTIGTPPNGTVANRITMALSQADLTGTVGPDGIPTPGALPVGDYWYALVLLDAGGNRVQNGLVAVGAVQVIPTGLS